MKPLPFCDKIISRREIPKGGICLNINDVAREAGVSKTTVSRVLLGSDKVKPDTREKVQEVIRRLNYTPNTSAQMLAKKRNRVLGVIGTLPISDPFYAYMHERIAQECEQRGYGTLYVTCGERPGNGCEKAIALLYGKVDGYIVTGWDHITEENIEQITGMGMPVALFKTGYIREGAFTVDIDNVKSGRTAARYLFEKGYRRIGYVHGGDERSIFLEGQERYRGFRNEMDRLGVPVVAEFNGGRNYQIAMGLADQIARSGIDALFCETDIMAYGVLAGLLEGGVKVPEQIAVLGFDDIKFRNFETQIHLSTVSQPLEQIAACMVSALVDRIEYGTPYSTIRMFETKIVEGRTT